MQADLFAVLIDQLEVRNFIAWLRLSSSLRIANVRRIDCLSCYNDVFKPRLQTRDYKRRLHSIAFGHIAQQALVF